MRDIIQTIKQGYDFPFILSYPAGKVGGVHIHLFFMLVVFATAIVVIVINKVFCKKKLLDLNTYHCIPAISLIYLAVLILLQLTNNIQNFRKEYHTFADKTQHEKLVIHHKRPYEFAQFCRNYLSGQFKGGLITDIDINREPYMEEHRILAYFLFPTVDIRDIHTDKARHCLVVYRKKDPYAFIPADYKIVAEFDSESLLAIKR